MQNIILRDNNYLLRCYRSI